MISFIEADRPPAFREHYAAKTSAIMSLGFLINKSGNQQALDFLKQAANPQTWASKRMGVAPFPSSMIERNFDLSKHAVLGLALSGRPEAAEVLRSLQQPTDVETQRQFQAQVGDLVSEALKENERIAKQGLELLSGAVALITIAARRRAGRLRALLSPAGYHGNTVGPRKLRPSKRL